MLQSIGENIWALSRVGLTRSARLRASVAQRSGDIVKTVGDSNAKGFHFFGRWQEVGHHHRHHAGRRSRTHAVMAVFQSEAILRRDTKPTCRCQERAGCGLPLS